MTYRWFNFIAAVVAVVLALYLNSFFQPPQFTSGAFQISDARTPEASVDLIKKACSGRTDEFCTCFMKRVYQTTTLAERVLFIYHDHWNPFLSNDLIRIRDSARRQMLALQNSCER